MTTHILKTLPIFFEAVFNGTKKFEIRKNDRDFQVNDILILAEYHIATNTYTGRELLTVITFMTDYKQQDNYVVMSLGEQKR